MSLGIRCGRVVLGFELLAISRDESCTHNNMREKQASKFQTVVTSGGGGSGHMVYPTVGGVLYVERCGRCLGVCVFAILYINVEMFVIRQTPVASVSITCAHRYLHTPSHACVVHTMQRTHTHTHANIPAALLSGPRSVSKAFGLAPLPLGCLGSPEPRV